MYSTNPHDEPPDASPHSLSTRVLTAVADAKECTPDDLEPLYNVVNPEALDELFAPQADGTTRADGSVSFQYAGYRVTVSSEGNVSLESHNA
ncbi:HalOD1 output domain-containing protein [Haladaptatus pallidirubidus]|uniref:Halobacterial output domain-containing protein n=1 Tax=Haladaptatus pallidirubidus TaxID=1008152 RepID=A0AAV3UMS0_9EURY|nr:HalOD1 output domain-containing protein [Haladaptatus pallidirubidus]